MVVPKLNAELAGRYIIERSLGKGGMATVFLAEDVRHRRRVAVKVMNPELRATMGSTRFHREIETASRLRHPHILPLFDSGETESFLYYVMPYVEGETLRQRLARESQLPLDEAVTIAREVADGLDYAHRRGVVHRDIKPENILLEEGHAVVADFGIARAVSGTDATGDAMTITQAGAMIGTPAYMSPEQAAGRVDLDQRSDIYSLGCVLYEMLAGQPPFVGQTVESLVKQHLSVEPQPVANLRPGVPSVVSATLNRALAKRAADRFPTAGAFARGLRRASTALGIVVDSAGRFGGWRRGMAAAAAVAALVVTAIVLGYVVSTPGESALTSLAVLPFDNLMENASEDYFVDGMTEAIITGLSQIGALKTISRTSVMQYKGIHKPLPEIARALHVDAVVEGSVLRIGDRVRITASLVDAAKDRQLWGDSYERDVTDVLDLQMEVARAIAEKIRVVLSPQERAQLSKSAAVNPEAYEAYLRGRYHWSKRTPEGFQNAIREFQRATEIDPGYAQAFAGLADAYILLVEWELDPASEGVPRAKAAALEALRLDSMSAEAYTSLGEVRISEWDWEGAENAFRRALRLNPGYPTAHQWYGFFLSKMGRHEEAIRELQRALDLDPLSLIVHTEFGRVYMHAGQLDEAMRISKRAQELDPSFTDVNYVFGHVAILRHQYEDAIKAFEPYQEYPFRSLLGAAYALAGRTNDARRILEEFKDRSRRASEYVHPGLLADLYAALGEHDEALALLEQLYDLGIDDRLTYLKVDPWLDPLRNDPRFQDLVRRMRFP